MKQRRSNAVPLFHSFFIQLRTLQVITSANKRKLNAALGIHRADPREGGNKVVLDRHHGDLWGPNRLESSPLNESTPMLAQQNRTGKRTRKKASSSLPSLETLVKCIQRKTYPSIGLSKLGLL